MRWLLLKDLQILKRSPLLVSLLVIYPVAIALLIGLALSRGPEKPKVAFVSLAPNQSSLSLGGEDLNLGRAFPQLRKSIDIIRVRTREEALGKVRSGDALAAVVVPADIVQKLSTGIQRPQLEVIYNGDAVKQQFVESTIKSRLADANAVLSAALSKEAASGFDILTNGGSFATPFGPTFNVLGLARTQEIVQAAIATLPKRSTLRAPLGQVLTFAKQAQSFLPLANQGLRAVGSPLALKQSVLQGRRTPLDAFAVAIAVTVSLMFITVLLAAGLLAVEREEHTFSRLVRGLVSRLGLVTEKIGLAALCAFGVTLVMLMGIALFVNLDWGRFPFWVIALALGAIAFAAMGVAIGGLAREVRAASLLAFLLSLPIAFLALVPENAVSGALGGVIQVVSFLFPFKAAEGALNAAINDAGGLGGALVHLAALTLGFAAIGRVALRRLG